MPISRLLRRARPRSISRYALAFFVVLAAALGMLAAAILHDVARLNQRIAQSDETLAKQELTEAIALLSQHAEQVAQKLIHWDEARAQLQDSTYYGYWRNSRALAAGVLPGAIDAIDLYDSHGRNLSPVTLNESYMPPRSSAADMRPVLVHERGHDHLRADFGDDDRHPVLPDGGVDVLGRVPRLAGEPQHGAPVALALAKAAHLPAEGGLGPGDVGVERVGRAGRGGGHSDQHCGDDAAQQREDSHASLPINGGRVPTPSASAPGLCSSRSLWRPLRRRAGTRRRRRRRSRRGR